MVSRSIAAAKATAPGKDGQNCCLEHRSRSCETLSYRRVRGRCRPRTQVPIHQVSPRRASAGGVEAASGPEPGRHRRSTGHAELIVVVTVLKVALICEPRPTSCANDANRDQGRDQSIFDRRGTRPILHETHDMLLRDNSPVYHELTRAARPYTRPGDLPCSTHRRLGRGASVKPG